MAKPDALELAERLEAPMTRDEFYKVADGLCREAAALLRAQHEALEPFADFGEYLALETEGFSDADRLELVPKGSDVRFGDLFISAFRRARSVHGGTEAKPDDLPQWAWDVAQMLVCGLMAPNRGTLPKIERIARTLLDAERRGGGEGESSH